MKYLNIIILGIVQGIAEFLPISSSGHLAVLSHIMNYEEPSLFVAQMLHFGTFLSVLYFYRRDVATLFIEFINLIKKIFSKDKTPITKNQKMVLYILLACIPTALIALIFEETFASLYSNMKMISLMFLVTAILLYFIDTFTGTKEITDTNVLGPIGIGMVQGLAILPGISRSGSTIFAATFLEVNKKEAAKFSFLLSLPATFGAFIFGLKDAVKAGETMVLTLPVIIGIVVSFVVGVYSLRFLIDLINRNKLKYFSIYLVIIAIITFFIK